MGAPVAKREMYRPQSEGSQDRSMSNSTERKNHRSIREFRYLLAQIVVTGPNLLGSGLVLRRNAAHGVGNPASAQPQPVPAPAAGRPVCKAEPEQCFVQQKPGEIPGERPPGGIGAMQPRSQPHDEQCSACIAEGRHRPGIVMRVSLAGLGEKASQAGTPATLSSKASRRASACISVHGRPGRRCAWRPPWPARSSGGDRPGCDKPGEGPPRPAPGLHLRIRSRVRR